MNEIAIKPAKQVVPSAMWEVKCARVCEDPPVASLSCPADTVDLWKRVIETAPWYDEDRECLVVFLLNTRLKARAFALVSIGSLSETVAHPRETLRAAVMSASHGIVIAHNHPGGDPQPSHADRNYTRRLRECCEIMQIHLCDHVIVGRSAPDHPGYFSFRESGML